jgi:hypothetical protein
MKKQKEYENDQLGTESELELEAIFKRVWKEYREWFNTKGHLVQADRADYRDSKIGIRLGLECGHDPKKVLDEWIKLSSFHPIIDYSFCC